MKLLLCIKCNDIFSLTMEERTCKCGKSSGKLVDPLNAEIKGDCMPIGFAKQSFLDALRRQHIENKRYDRNKDTCYKGQEFTAFVIPDYAKSVKRVEEKKEATT
jgi:hypothetical protein